jgi:3-hydroxyacyl-[acyl-carrier-protein] dehydratase
MYLREAAMVNFDVSVASAASPLIGAVRIRAHEPDRILTSFTVDHDEPVLVGHFPGYPILPGVCLVECAHRSALLALAGRGVPLLVGIDRARFQQPVFPGDEVLTDLSVAADGDAWSCRARLTVRRDAESEPLQAAQVRLRYELRDGTEGRDAGAA